MILNRNTLLINLLFLTSVLIFLHIGPLSISFPVGVIALLNFSGKVRLRLFQYPFVLLTLLFIVGLISSALSELPFKDNIYFMVQFLYWLLLAIMVGELYPYINFKLLSRTLAYGSIILGAVYFLLGGATQNSVAFCLVVIAPLGLYGIEKRSGQIIYALVLLFYMLFNESRTGLAILVIEMLFVFSRLFAIHKLTNILLSIIGTVVLIMTTPLHISLGEAIEPYNPDMALLISDPDAVFYSDKSWIQRKIQVQKGMQIFEEHPLIGIGPSNFSKLEIDIDVSNMQGVDADALNAALSRADFRSSHNSYVSLLSEFGIIGTLFFLLFIFKFLIIAFRNSKRLDDFEFLLLVCCIGMCLYFYNITALYGTSAWLFYGLLCGYINKYRKKI